MPRTWRFLAHNPSRVRQLSSDLHVSPLVAQVLIARGLGEEADEFLNARLTGLHDIRQAPGLFDELLEPIKGVDELLRVVAELAQRPSVRKTV